MEKSGYASSFYAMHGANAYALGLKVEDASETVTRAKALGVTMFNQAPGPGEIEIPAIEGVGGGVIYFLDESHALSNVWETEFRREDSAPSASAGLTRIDHVAQTMNYDEMLTWLLFYNSIFRTARAPMVDVVDPGGVVRSQAVENNSGLFRMTLNGADNRKTIAGRFLAESFGSGIQHLAFVSDDIFKTAEALASLGFTSLPVSRNYYDDLEARFGLDPEFADQLRESNIFYDRDDNGEYFQIYSRNFGEGFFFEIVERRGNYRGYGAANAPFRIGAQRRLSRHSGIPKG